MKMKIVMFGHKRIPSREGGIEVVVEALSTRMAAKGHQVICCNRTGKPVCGETDEQTTQRIYRGVRLRSVPTVNGKGLAALTSSFFASLFSAVSGADVVHIHGEGPALFSWIPKLAGRKTVVTIHGLDWKRDKWHNGIGAKLIHLGEKAAVSWADEIIVLDRSLQQYFQDTYGRRTTRIPNGVVMPQLRPAQRITRAYGLEKDGYILYLGRLVPEKGIHDLIVAYRQLKTENRYLYW